VELKEISRELETIFEIKDPKVETRRTIQGIRGKRSVD